WDQSVTVPPPEEMITSTAPPYVPPDERPWWHGKILAALAFVALLVGAFLIGMLIHGFEPGEVKAAQKKEPAQQLPAGQTFKPAPRSNVTLVPVTGSGLPEPIEQPITSTPPQTPGQQPNDATAMPANQYAAAAARAKAQCEAAKNNALVDPRSITGPADEQ